MCCRVGRLLPHFTLVPQAQAPDKVGYSPRRLGLVERSVVSPPGGLQHCRDDPRYGNFINAITLAMCRSLAIPRKN
eukprot:12402392-Karenia_brevis.AAC.1